MGQHIRRLDNTDAAALDAFLAPHTAEAYFLRSNAQAAGLSYEGKDLQAEYFGAFENDKLVGALAYTWIDTILCYAAKPEALPELVQACLPSIDKREGKIEAVLGLKPLADIVIKTLGLTADAFQENGNDGLFRLNLAEMKTPPLPQEFLLRPAQEKDRELLIAWRVAFNIEAVHAQPGPALNEKVAKEIDRRLSIQKDLFILEKDGAPVSYCGIAGSVPACVIVGPVWTPPELRGRGYAKLCTAHGLKKVAENKPALAESVLFASRADAIAVYESIGFKRIADWRLAILKEDFRLSIAQTISHTIPDRGGRNRGGPS